MDQLTPSCYDGWESYPRNLSLSVFEGDVSRFHTRLSDDAERLFIGSEEECEVLLREFLPLCSARPGSPEEIRIDSLDSLSLCFQKAAHTRIFRIAQEYSWGRLLISEELFRKLLTAVKAHPRFLDVVHLLGEKITEVNESFTICFTRLYTEPSSNSYCSYDITYSLKYIAKHGHQNVVDPFCIRETGVYHQFRADAAVNTWIFLHPPEHLNELIARAMSDLNILQPAGQLCYHAIVLDALSHDWQDYVNYAEATLSDLLDRGFFTNTTRSAAGPGKIETSFRNIRSLHIMTDKLKKLIHLLKLNRNVCERLQGFCRRMQPQFPLATLYFDQCESLMDNFKFQTETHILQFESVLSRAEGIGALIEQVIDAGTGETNHEMNRSMHALSKQGIEDNKLMRQLTARSTQDTRSMAVIAIISAIFLPATFVATVFGTNFFGFEESDDGHNLEVASNIWIYAIAAVGCSITTVGLGYCWWSRRQPTLDGASDLELGASELGGKLRVDQTDE